MTRHAAMNPEAKALLSATLRRLRARLLTDLAAAAEGAYRLSVSLTDATLPEAAHTRRRRLEDWLDEQVRATPRKDQREARARYLHTAVREAAYTAINRLVIVRVLEALGLSKPAVLTGGWTSPGYREFREFAPGLCGDDTEGYGTLLALLFGELAHDLPGVFGDVGLTSLFPIPPATLRAAVEDLSDPRLDTAWTDDTTLGWVYQYWNDPDREALDAKIASGGKIQPHEIASKTQMFTERYMVEWLLQNSLGPMWLAMCRKNGWEPVAETSGVLADLERRRIAWRARRDAGEVPLDALMPIEGGLEDRWKYYVPQPIPEDAVTQAAASVRELKILDPACGSGHFLVIAFDLLAALYREEAVHRGLDWSDRQIAEWIVEDNLHGLDIDPRAVQIAAAALVLKVRTFAPGASPKRMHLVASNLRLGSLESDDPALQELRREVRAATGMPESLTNHIIEALRGADHLGSLLQVEAALEAAFSAHEQGHTTVEPAKQLRLGDPAPKVEPRDGGSGGRASLDATLEAFLAKHTGGDDLGLRLRGEQLAAGIRFVRMVKEGTYHLVVGNPPYQGTSKMADAKYIEQRYPRGKADLYAAFLERGLQLCREFGSTAMITMRNWMFIHQYALFRDVFFGSQDLRMLGDVSWGAFEEMRDNPVVMTVVRRSVPSGVDSLAVAPTDPQVRVRTLEEVHRKAAGLLCQARTFRFQTSDLQEIPERPLVYWWDAELLEAYPKAPLIGTVSPGCAAQSTGDNVRFVRSWWEIGGVKSTDLDQGLPIRNQWFAFVNGSDGLQWLEPLRELVNWHPNGLPIKTSKCHKTNVMTCSLASEDHFLERPGIAFSMIGSDFAARAHRFPSILGDMGSSVFPTDIPQTLSSMNSARSRMILQSLNPGVHFQVGDVNRLPMFPIALADEIYFALDHAFTEHEQSRETSVEFRHPGPSPWRYAQDWAQRSVDRSEGAPLPPYDPVYDPPDPAAFVSYAFGIALGRFESPTEALPDGILYLSSSGAKDSLDHPSCAGLDAAWNEHGAAVAKGKDLRTWLRTDFFAIHKRQYENRPIWWPLSSAKKSFVAWVAIHRMGESTLTTLLARYLLPEKTSLDGRLGDARAARGGPDKKAAAQAERQFTDLKALFEELSDFIAQVTECAERGPPDDDGPKEVPARYAPDLDDGVMVNSSALWPLLWPQWRDPKKWWKELARPAGRKDYDWSHLAARYFPARVDAKCRLDPSLGVAHGCFWRYHPARAYAWELRLQDEIAPNFTLDEAGSTEARDAFLRDHAALAAELLDKEQRRREKKAAKAGKDDEDDAQLELDEAAGDAGDGDEAGDE